MEGERDQLRQTLTNLQANQVGSQQRSLGSSQMAATVVDKMMETGESLNQRTDQHTERSEKEYSEKYEESNKGDNNENNEIEE